MVSNKPRLGFVGVGAMGQAAHLANYARLSDRCELAAIAEVRLELGRTVAQRYGVRAVYSNASEMLENEEINAVVACQQFSRHGIIIEEISRAGLPILIEKPLASSVETGERILRILAERGVPVMVGYTKRSDPAVEYLIDRIEYYKASGELGPMKYVRLTMPPGEWIQGGFQDLISPPDGATPPTDIDPSPQDMDADTCSRYIEFVNYYIHQVNLARYLLREDYRVTYAGPGGVLLAGVSESGIDVSIEMNPYTTTVEWDERVLVAFERCRIEIALPAPLAVNEPGTVTILEDPGSDRTPMITSPQLPRIHAMKNQAVNFIAFVKGERPAPCEAEEALKDLKLARDYVRLLIE